MKCGIGEIVFYLFQDENLKEYVLRVIFLRFFIYVSLINMERVVIFGDMRFDFSVFVDFEIVFIFCFQGGYVFFYVIYDIDDEIYIFYIFKEFGMKNFIFRIGRINYLFYLYYLLIEFWDGVEMILVYFLVFLIKGVIGDIVLRDNELIVVFGMKFGKEFYIFIFKKVWIIFLLGEFVFMKFIEKGFFLFIGQFRGYLYGGFVMYEDFF